MSDVLRFKAPGPWLTRELRECVQAKDYDALAARLAEARRLLTEAVEYIEQDSEHPPLLNEMTHFLIRTADSAEVKHD